MLTCALANVRLFSIILVWNACLSSGSNRDDLGFNHCEADAIMLSFYSSLRSSGYIGHAVIDSEDTDGYVQATSDSHDIPVLSVLRKRIICFCVEVCVLTKISQSV